MKENWTKYEPEGDGFIPVRLWGKDHWSTLAYLETCAVDQKGKVDNRRMRCAPRLHRELANISVSGKVVDGSAYPTRLKYSEEAKHDDWSCLEDAAKSGILVAEFREVARLRKKSAFGYGEVRVNLTELGLRLTAELRAHKARGKSFAEFTPSQAIYLALAEYRADNGA